MDRDLCEKRCSRVIGRHEMPRLLPILVLLALLVPSNAEPQNIRIVT
jgi:hypothetical protein